MFQLVLFDLKRGEGEKSKIKRHQKNVIIQCKHIRALRERETLNLLYANYKGADQLVHPRSLVSAFGKFDSPSSFMVNEPVHEISNNVVCATSKASDQHV